MANGTSFFAHVYTNYEKMSDEEIVDLAKQGNDDAFELIIGRYKNLVSLHASRYYIIGAEKEDIVQEGMIGLFKAVKNFEKDKQNSFKTFADLCIKRQLITAIKTSNRQKHMPLNSYLSLSRAAYSEEVDPDTMLIDVIKTDVVEDPLETITNKESYEIIEARMAEALSDFEKDVLDRYLKGYSYNQIAKNLDAGVKSIDNAIQRIKKKASKFDEEI